MAVTNKRVSKPVKVTDEIAAIGCAAGDGLIREEVWKDSSGRIVRYNLAFINFHLFAEDNGRVLGYDTAHGLRIVTSLGLLRRSSLPDTAIFLSVLSPRSTN